MEKREYRPKPLHMNTEQTTFLNIFGEGLDPGNRWMVLKDLVPWDELEQAIDELGDDDRYPAGRPALPARVALGSLIIKEALGLTDRETVAQIQENPYLQAFLGFASFSSAKPFDSSTMVHFRKRLGADLINALNRLVVDQFHSGSRRSQDQSPKPPKGDGETGAVGSVPPGADGGSSAAGDDAANQGTLMLDATCAPADITHPNDLNVLNHAREITERVIDRCHEACPGDGRKPRTYRRKARNAFLRASKRKRKTNAQRRSGKRQQLQYIRRNIGHIDRLVTDGTWNLAVCGRLLMERLATVRLVHAQQWEMYRNRVKSVPDRIYNIAQPHVRAIRRSKPGKRFEWGAKVSSSCVDGFAFIERMQWDPYNETVDLGTAAAAYRDCHGHYPVRILADRIYRTRANRAWCRERGIRLAGIGPGRPFKDPAKRAAIAREAARDEADRQPMEGVFGRGKRRYTLDRIMTKLAGTSETAIAVVFLVMNLMRILSALVCLCASWFSRVRAVLRRFLVADTNFYETAVNHDRLMPEWQHGARGLAA